MAQFIALVTVSAALYYFFELSPISIAKIQRRPVYVQS